MQLQLAEGERIVKKGLANRYRSMFSSDGGRLVLTTGRLHFKPHPFNIDRDIGSWNISDLRVIDTSTPPGGFTLQFAGHQAVSFTVYRKNSWISALEDAAPNLIHREEITGKGEDRDRQRTEVELQAAELFKVAVVLPVSQVVGLWFSQTDRAMWDRLAAEAKAQHVPYFPIRGTVLVSLFLLVPAYVFYQVVIDQDDERKKWIYLFLFIAVEALILPLAMGFLAGQGILR